MYPSFWQILIVIGIVLLLFGTRKLRNAGKDLGAAVNDFKQAMHDSPEELKEDKKENTVIHSTHFKDRNSNEPKE